MIAVLLTAILSVIAPPATWTKEADTRPQQITGAGKAVAKYSTSMGATIQVRMEDCHGDKDLCDDFGGVGTYVSDYLSEACKGKFIHLPSKCIESFDPEGTPDNPPVWSNAHLLFENGDVLYVFVMNRRKSEKKLYVFIYAGPKTGALDFVKYTDKLKTKGM